MSWIGKWKKMKVEQRVEDIEQCRRHPTGWKIMMGLFAIGFSFLIVFMVVAGAYPLAIIAIVFTIWLEREFFRVYKMAFPKIDQAVEGLV